MAGCCRCVSPETRLEGASIAYQINYFDDYLYRKEGIINFYNEGGILAKSLVFVSIPFKVVSGTIASIVANAVCSVVFPFLALKDSKFLPVAMDCFMRTAFIAGWVALSIYVLPLSAAIALPATSIGLRIIGEWVKLVRGGPGKTGYISYNLINNQRVALDLKKID